MSIFERLVLIVKAALAAAGIKDAVELDAAEQMVIVDFVAVQVEDEGKTFTVAVGEDADVKYSGRNMFEAATVAALELVRNNIAMAMENVFPEPDEPEFVVDHDERVIEDLDEANSAAADFAFDAHRERLVFGR